MGISETVHAGTGRGPGASGSALATRASPGLCLGHLHTGCLLLQRPGRLTSQSPRAALVWAPQACVDQISMRGAEAVARVARPTAGARRDFPDSRVMRRLLRQPPDPYEQAEAQGVGPGAPRSLWSPASKLLAPKGSSRLRAGLHSHLGKGCRIESNGSARDNSVGRGRQARTLSLCVYILMGSSLR